MCGRAASRQSLAVRPVQVPEDDCEPCRLPGRQLARLAMTDLPLPRRGGTGRGSVPRDGGAIRGREHELQAVLELVRAAAKGRGGMLLIEGELGAGKSLLLMQAAAAAKAAGVSVAAAADELSRFMPLGPVLMALGESSAALADEARRRICSWHPGSWTCGDSTRRGASSGLLAITPVR